MSVEQEEVVETTLREDIENAAKEVAEVVEIPETEKPAQEGRDEKGKFVAKPKEEALVFLFSVLDREL